MVMQKIENNILFIFKFWAGKIFLNKEQKAWTCFLNRGKKMTKLRTSVPQKILNDYKSKQQSKRIYL